VAAARCKFISPAGTTQAHSICCSSELTLLPARPHRIHWHLQPLGMSARAVNETSALVCNSFAGIEVVLDGRSGRNRMQLFPAKICSISHRAFYRSAVFSDGKLGRRPRSAAQSLDKT
jgi:hypothetical protein